MYSHSVENLRIYTHKNHTMIYQWKYWFNGIIGKNPENSVIFRESKM